MLQAKASSPGGGTLADTAEFDYRGKISAVKSVVRQLREDNHGDLWLTTDHFGIFRLRFKSDSIGDVELKNFTTDHGLPKMAFNWIRKADREVWVATRDGIYRFLKTPEEHFEPHVGFQEALSHVDAEIDSAVFVDERRTLVYPLHEFGILTRDATGKFHLDSGPFQHVRMKQYDNVHLDADGVMWIPTGKGLLRYDSNQQKDMTLTLMVVKKI